MLFASFFFALFFVCELSKAVKDCVNVYVVVNFLSQAIFVFLLFLGMIMYANEVETKEK